MYKKSIRAFKESSRVIPGGVNSPVRAFKSVNCDPVFFERGKGSKLYDIDGNEYIDCVSSWGPLIFGHADSHTLAAVNDSAIRGTSYGAPTLIETEMANVIKDMVPSVEKVRMVNSGTEATMSAIRLARGFTNKNFIIKFSGNYHGHGDSFLIKAGSGALTLGLPDSPGVTENIAKYSLKKEETYWSAAKRIVNGWMNSTGHRKNILDYRFRYLGCGVSNDGKLIPYKWINSSETDWYVYYLSTQNFMD